MHQIQTLIKKSSPISPEYLQRINKVFLYIDQNIKDKLTLETVAAQAHYSPYHFHRIFKAIAGEPLNAYISRRRLEKSALLLARDNSTTIEEVYLECGFNSHSSFTRAFKKHYQLSPTAFREKYQGQLSKIGQVDSKDGQMITEISQYIYAIEKLKQWIIMNAKIEVKKISSFDTVYITQIGPAGLESAFERLMVWAEPKGLLKDDFKMATIYHDSYKTTNPEKIRMSASLLVDTPVQEEGEVSAQTIEGGNYIIGRFEIGIHEFEQSWTGLFVWMGENGYKLADRQPFEIYHNDFREHPENICIVDFYIPVQ